MKLHRRQILPEPRLPDPATLIEQGRESASGARGRCAFLDAHEIGCEIEYKRRRMAEGRIMFQAQIGFRDPFRTARGCAEVHSRLIDAGGHLDRFGFIFDRNMGYLPSERAERPRGTGLIVEDAEQLAALASAAPVAPHFGDHMIGPPASLDNARMALSAGSTSLGNLAQYYTFDLLYEKSDIPRTSATIQAIALAAAQPVEILIHSNIEDSFAALFTDLSSCLGMVMVEQYIVGELLGATVAHCYGQTFSDSFKRLAFQRALRRLEPDAGTMFVCNTSGYGRDEDVNYAVLASDLTTDMIAQRLGPTPHALVPIPVTEFARIPDIDEIVAVHKFAHRLLERLEMLLPLIDLEPVDRLADSLIEGATRFKDNLLGGLETAGIETTNPVELLLAIRRLGAKRLEALFGAGDADPDEPRGRRPVVVAATVSEIRRLRDETLAALEVAEREAIASRDLVVCVASTDVHEWGKLLVESVFDSLGVRVVDGGVNADPDDLAELARRETVDLIALSTYNGIALSYVSRLQEEMALRELTLPVFVGGRLNQVLAGSNTSLPVDVSDRLREAGVQPCESVGEMLSSLAHGAPGDQSPR